MIHLEQSEKFSKSKIWQFQEEYFDSKGIQAWVYGVPYYVTSNALIAYCYAQMTLRYIQDGLMSNLIDANEPIYMIEMGTGSGKFSFLFLKTLKEFFENYKLTHLKFTYVMSDFTKNNMHYWEKHTAFQPFIETGMLDFAIYRIGEDHPIHLEKQGITLGKGTVKNPIIAVGNYIFDTVPHDVFKVEDGKLYEGLISIETQADNVSNGQVQSLEKLQTSFDFKEIQTPYYNHPAMDNILDAYKQNLTKGTFLIPTGAFAAIDLLRSISNDKLFVICSDKGYTCEQALEGLATPHIAFHGSFSMMVNFDAIGKYVENLGGEIKLASNNEGMKTNVLMMGSHFDSMPESNWAYSQFAEHFCTKEFLLVKNEMIQNPDDLNLQQILALLKMSYWDPDIFMSIANSLSNQVGQASRFYLLELREGMQAIYNNYYFMPNYKNILFELGRLYHVIGDFDDAILRYRESEKCFGEDPSVYFNIGLCRYYQGDKQQALSYFEQTLGMDANHQSAKEWIEYINAE